MGRLINTSDLVKSLFDYENGKKTLGQCIDDTPTAQQWIPCSETVYLPKHEVLCCDKYGEELIGWLSYEDDQWLCESDAEMMYDPVAWMEKPKPWKGES